MHPKKLRTQKQIEASRRNGAKSRGPLTPEGKARSARNSYRHGFRSIAPYAALGDLTIDQNQIDEFKDCLLSEYKAQTPDELRAVESLAWIECLLRRLREIEKSRLNAEILRLKRERPGLSGTEYCALATLALAEIGFLSMQGRLETRLHAQRTSEFDRLLRISRRPQKNEITNEPGIRQKTNGLLVSGNLSETQEPGSLRYAA